MSRRPANPYVNRLMIRDRKDFIGRALETEKVFSRLGAARPQSISIIGERRIGKSSLLYQLYQPTVRGEHLIDPDSYTFVFIDLHGLMGITVDEFLDLFVEEVVAASGIDFDSGTGAPGSGYLAVRRLLPRLERAGKKLIVLWDEFEAITGNANFAEDFFSFFRSLANRFDVAYVTTSSRELQELCHTEEIAVSPFFNIFTNLYLGTFLPEEARELIRRPSEAAGVPLGPHEEFLLDLAGYMPFFQQMACCALFEELSERPAGETTYEDVLRQFAAESEPHLRYIWEHLDAESKDLLRRAAAGSQPVIVRGDIEERLIRDGYLLRASPGPYRLASRVLGKFIQRQDDISHPVDERFASFSGTAAPVSERFTIVREIGRGAMGKVALAQDNLLDQEVALKILSRKQYEDAGMVLRFKRETALARGLHHPNICPVFDVLEEQGFYYISMKYIDGSTLKEWLVEHAPLELPDLVSISRQVLRALSEAHQVLIHRDIKPQNIMLDANRRAYLTDFGLACLPLDASDTLPGTLVGTPGYMPPEQIEGSPVDQRADLYSLGAVMYEMATGRLPFVAESLHQLLHAHVYETPVSPAELRPDLPHQIDDIIMQLLEKKPDARPPSAVSVLSRLGSRQGEPGSGEWEL